MILPYPPWCYPWQKCHRNNNIRHSARWRFIERYFEGSAELSPHEGADIELVYNHVDRCYDCGFKDDEQDEKMELLHVEGDPDIWYKEEWMCPKCHSYFIDQTSRVEPKSMAYCWKRRQNYYPKVHILAHFDDRNLSSKMTSPLPSAGRWYRWTPKTGLLSSPHKLWISGISICRKRRN